MTAQVNVVETADSSFYKSPAAPDGWKSRRPARLAFRLGENAMPGPVDNAGSWRPASQPVPVHWKPWFGNSCRVPERPSLGRPPRPEALPQRNFVATIQLVEKRCSLPHRG